MGPTNVAPIIFADDDQGVAHAVEDLVRANLIAADDIHIWDCGVSSAADLDRRTEFEDNFADEELIEGANLLGEGDLLTTIEFAKRLAASARFGISKVLERYYSAEYGVGWSKPKLGRILAEHAIRRIKERDKRGRDGERYEFEEVIRRLLG